MAERDPRTVLLKRVRLSFPDIKEPGQAVKDGKLRYGAKLVIEFEGDDSKAKALAAENKAKAIAAMEAAGDQAWKNTAAYKGIMEDDPKRVSFRSGKRFKNKETGEVYAGYDGNFVISASGPAGGKKRPQLKDRMKRDVVEKDIEDVFYPGTYVDAYVSFYGTDEGGRGLFASIDLLRSHQEGKVTARTFTFDDDELDDLDDDTPEPGAKASGDDLDDF
ncbi:ssDNA-binding protein [Sphingobium lignivorans]|uniref:DUF2815 family protein n=1 Tax=Sphingobium lignivorans TaxID=2735886 RepID=A0ABR6NFH0_9SPHN|nr:ssDNA-binding protein [Sphingobium lignivorans]MBB5986011.1 hypothetical protein [Sphingobium lignivorans]